MENLFNTFKIKYVSTLIPNSASRTSSALVSNIVYFQFGKGLNIVHEITKKKNQIANNFPRRVGRLGAFNTGVYSKSEQSEITHDYTV